ncbi:hypothetical protein J7E93_18965 [Streptomyces sp. ISL-36]|uniref:hypothetical protein n=1 Tax=Streptomyces sp. ISL-36 TaxID=2819182 RepID=UPI001BE8FE1B|nr:hypothetical protein [Streptomyces sp. ISL-36]MBT2442146.1 hypothetical protein [Streptomyces sp. ISL-36]
MTDPVHVARFHGWFHLVTGAWPLVHRRSFEQITGPKVDVWLLQTVSGLLVTIGWTQIRAAEAGVAPARGLARQLGTLTASTLLAIDVVYATRRRIRPVYFLDAAFQVLWLTAWYRSGKPENPDKA